MACVNCKHFDGFDAVRSTLVNCDLYGELNTYDAEDMCLGYEEKEKKPTKLYEIRFSDGNDIDQCGRVSAKTIDEATDYAIKQYLNQEIDQDKLIESIDGDDQHTYVMLNACIDCPYYELTDKEKQRLFKELNGEKIKLSEIDTICEYCETSGSYLEINEIIDPDPGDYEFKTIYGTNEYANLETDTRPTEYNPLLAKAWRTDPQLGATELMYQTINDNPKMVEAVSPEYLHKINETHRKLTLEGDTK